MTSSQLRELSQADLAQAILQKSKDLFKIRMQCYAGIEQKTHLMKECRRSIARMKTIFNQKVQHVTKD